MNRIFKIISLLLFSFSLVAQNESNSPYSRFGLGDIQTEAEWADTWKKIY